MTSRRSEDGGSAIADTRLPVLEVRNLAKAYGDSVVLDHVDLDVWAGEVHALLGENGAGKSTLIKIVSGVVMPDAGHVKVNGLEFRPGSPRVAMQAGVATLHQELATVGGLTVAENVFLGRDVPTFLGKMRWGPLNAAARAIFADLGQDIDVTLDAELLSPVGRTMTSLARAVSQQSSVLILDEPTASLTGSETTDLFAAMRRLQQRGIGILYVSHRLEEVFGIADRYTVLRNGQLVGTGTLGDTSVEAVITMMAGRPVDTLFPERHPKPGAVMLEAQGLSGKRVRDVSLNVHAGEVVGIAGLAGSGRSEVLRMIGGAQRRVSGITRVEGREFNPGSPGDAHHARVALVPQERRSESLIPDSVERNLNSTTIDAQTSVGRFLVSRPKERKHAQRLWEEFHIRGHGLDQQVMELSGGNQQKVSIAKFLALKPRVLLLDEPTRGVDVSTKVQIYRLIRQQADMGCAVLVVSSELPELQGLCDRIVVLHEGRAFATFDGEKVSEEELLQACYGRSA
jgi:ABC-type sugar transport system ATPase subunit